MSRRDLVIYGNCQASAIWQLLQETPAFSERFNAVLAINFAPPGVLQPEAPPEASHAALYWEQYDERPTVPAREAVREALAKDAQRLVFPPIAGMSLWPFAIVDKRNEPEPGYPWGRYPWGDRIGAEIAKLDLPQTQIADAYLELSSEKMPDPATLIARDDLLAQRRDAASDVRIGDFIEEHRRDHHLFWTWGHTSSLLNVELALRLLRASAATIGPVSDELERQLREAGARIRGIGNEQLPYHPLIIRAAELTFVNDDSRYEWFGQRWTFREYITRYIAFDRSW